MKQRKKARTTGVSLRLPEDVFTKVKIAADKVGLSPSMYVRLVVFDAINKGANVAVRQDKMAS